MAGGNQIIKLGPPDLPYARIEHGGDIRKFIHVYCEPGFKFHAAYDFDNGRIEISVDPKPLDTEEIQ